MDIVGAVTGQTLLLQPLETQGGVAIGAGDGDMLSQQREAGEIVVKADVAGPVRRAMAGGTLATE